MTGQRNDGATEEIREVTEEAKAVFEASAVLELAGLRGHPLSCTANRLLAVRLVFASFTSRCFLCLPNLFRVLDLPELFGLVAASHLQCHNFSWREARNRSSKKSRLTV